MKTFQRIVPVVAVVVALGGAIYYVQSNAPVRPEPVFFHARIVNARLDCHPERVELKTRLGGSA